MNRRNFIQQSITASVALSANPAWLMSFPPQKKKSIAAYYLCAGMFTQNPDNLKRNLDLMKSWGTDILCISMHFMQLKRAGINTDRIAEKNLKAFKAK
ncbi:MAG: hypothetical protein AAFO07_25085 [Bacteroidota bacterium]